MLLLWSMRERYNLASKFKPYFDTLPANFNTGTRILLCFVRKVLNLVQIIISPNALPGLSFGIDALAALEGTLLFDEIMQAKQVIPLWFVILFFYFCKSLLNWYKAVIGSLLQHLRQQYDELFPLLCTNFPGIFRKDVCTWDNFLWACELWYSNSMMIVLCSGKLSTCLVPVAGLLNHSVCSSVPGSFFLLVFRFVSHVLFFIFSQGVPSYFELWSSR